jgi:hypothetical protein
MSDLVLGLIGGAGPILMLVVLCRLAQSLHTDLCPKYHQRIPRQFTSAPTAAGLTKRLNASDLNHL